MQTIRATNFTNEEKIDLLDKIFVYRHIIENKQSDITSISKKDEAWANITREYNENRSIIRTEKKLRSCWDNIKRDTRKYCAALKQESYKTGILKVDIKEKRNYEIEILKAKLEKEKLKIDLLKIIKNKCKVQSDIIFKL
ncbi:myb/SANT-like DNA-binding domain-containing protein 3 [Temnothorax americanus]|uniref:myb/SANT-like DNA-binding domain-containing protein 3 n=1 Tax=Temnothorax americanus TaxID=1964332 RepID=UPI0040697C3E